MNFAWKAVTAVTFSFETSVFVNNTSTHESYPIYDFRLRADFVFNRYLSIRFYFICLRNVTLALLGGYVRVAVP
jgi:hypothetical protein